jgi:hypothetical protein
MRDAIGATLTRTIACSKCAKKRHVCVADIDEAACLRAMNYERKHGICAHCEHEEYEAREAVKAA